MNPVGEKRLGDNSMELSFLGAAGTVTGSKTLVRAGTQRILVDCGLFQGIKRLRLKNREDLPLSVGKIDRVILTHAHLDHSGYLPRLMQQGYSGKIFCTRPTQQLLRILLLDAAHLEEEEARRANRLGYSRHHPALPLFTQRDVTRVLKNVEVLSEGEWHSFGKGVKVRLHENGHILGSVTVELSYGGRRLLFSGDLGRRAPLMLRGPKPPPLVDWLVLESTYGDRLHEAADPALRLGEIIQRTVLRGGKVLIPTFAVGRCQDLLYLLMKLKNSGALPRVPVYVDSPMAIEVGEVLLRNLAWQKLSRAEVKEVFSEVRLVQTARESEALRSLRKPAIILAGSGMITGGRILGHLEDCLFDPRHTVVLAGYQAPGTRGRLLQDGATELKIRGRFIPVKAEVARIDSLSAHADRAELLEWVQRCPPRSKIFLVHGEPQAADSLRVLLQDRLGVPVKVAEEGARERLGPLA